jgi:radical SAM protein with 4Fe4S-binding SPASM domain
MRMPMGNIREERFATIWRRPHTEVDRVRAATWGSLPVCGSCDARGGCQRCPGLAYHEDGDALGPSSTHCDLTFARQPKEVLPA